MRVLYWSELFRPNIGGVEIFCEQVINYLTPKGFEFVMVTSREGVHAPIQDVFKGIDIRLYPFQQALIAGDLATVRKTTDHLFDFIKSWKPDIIHLHTSGPTLFYYERCARRLNMPTILTFHSPVPPSAAPRALLARVLRTLPHVNGISQMIRSQLLAFCPEIEGRCSVIMNGFEAPDLEPTPVNFAPPQFLCIGRLVKEKGFDMAVSAFALFRQHCPEARLVVAGDGVERPALEQQTKKLGLGSSVEFLGWTLPEDIPQLINICSCVIMPSCYPEPFGFVAVQAGQMGRPIVATRAGAIPEIVLHNETGLMVEQRDVAAMAEAMEWMVRHPEEAAAMGSRARVRVLREFDFKRMVDEYEAMYERTLSAGSGA